MGFLWEHYFALVSEIADNPIEVSDENSFIQALTIEMSHYFGHEYLAYTKVKLNLRMLQFIMRNISKMYQQQINWYLERAPGIDKT